MQNVINALETLRVGVMADEFAIQSQVSKVLTENGIVFQKEARLARGKRVDFLCENGIAIEVKRGMINKNAVLKQLTGYAMEDNVKGLILLTSKKVAFPEAICQKPLKVMGSFGLWGVAL